MESLHFKIASGVISIIILISAFYFVTDYYSNRSRLMVELHKSADQLALVSLQSLLELAMFGQHPELLQTAIERLGSNTAVDRILLLDLSGQTHFSSREEDLGRIFSIEEEGCRSCHGPDTPTQNRRSELMNLGGRKILRTVRLVPNREDCHVCHDPSQKDNGILIIDFSTAEVEAQLRADLQASLFRTGLTALITLIVLGLLINKLILIPIAKLTGATATLSRGDRSAELEAIKGKDEIGELARSFSEMSRKVQTSIHSLRSQQAYLQELMDSLPDALIVVDQDRTVVMTNRTADGLWSREQVAEIVTKQERFPEVGRALMLTLLTGELMTCQIKLEAVETPSGQGPRFAEIQCSPLRDSENAIVNAILLVRDVTQRKTFEAQVSRADRLASIGQLAAGFAHEINNPLAAITTCVEGLERHVSGSGQIQPADRQEIEEYLSIIEEAALRCKGITRRLLTASVERGPTEMEAVDMAAMVQDVAALIGSQAQRQGVDLQVVTPDNGDHLIVFGNREKLSQLTLNLLLNGLEATTGKGAIRIEVSRTDDCIELQVADQGCGIPEEQLEHIFDPFYTTKTEGRGTGLGLALAEWIVRQHQAVIEVKSRVGEGTTFSVRFPGMGSETS